MIHFLYILSFTNFSDDPLIQKALQLEQKSHNLTKLNLSEPLKQFENVVFDLDDMPIARFNPIRRIVPKKPQKIYLRQKEIVVNNTIKKLRFSYWTFLTDLFHTMSGFPYDFKIDNTTGWTLPSTSGNFTFLISKNAPHILRCFMLDNDVLYNCHPKKFQIDTFTLEQQHFYSLKYDYTKNKQYFQSSPFSFNRDIIGFRIIVYENYGSNTTTCLTGLKVFPTC